MPSDHTRKASMQLLLSWAIAMGLLWLSLSGHFDLLLLSLGAGSVTLVAGLAWAFKLHPGLSVGVMIRSIPYFLWLGVQVIKSNLDVAKRILSPGLPLKPVYVRVPASQRSDLGLAIHANSITLTPGTLSIDVGQGEILVHALHEDIAEDLLMGEFDRRASRLERGGP